MNVCLWRKYRQPIYNVCGSYYSCINTFCCSYDHPHIIAGQGTMGLEIVEQVPDIDAVVVPVGGGGLIAGVALAVKSLHPNVKIIVSNFHLKTIGL